MVNDTNIRQFRIDLNKAIEDVAKRYGVEAKLGNIRYGDEDGHSTIKWHSLSAEGKPYVSKRTEAAAQFMLSCHMIQIEGAVIGRKVGLRDGKVGVVSDWNMNARRYPVVVKIGSSTYKTSINAITNWNA